MTNNLLSYPAMKMNFQVNCLTNQKQILTALVLTGILSVSSSMSLLKSATAAPVNINSTVETSNVITQNTHSRRLPRSVVNAILKDLSLRQGVLTNNIDIIEYTEKTWNNGCLELPKSGEFCTQALVPGWRVVASDGRQNWVYHTNRTGRTLRLSSHITSDNNFRKLPEKVREAVFNAASRRLNVSVSHLKVIQAEKRDWRNGCLELPEHDRVCSQAIVPGWRVVVGTKQQALVYHTNDRGSVVRINLNASEINSKNLPEAVPIPSSELPPRLRNDVVFRQISSGGFAGLTYETVLLNDGRLIRTSMGDTNDSDRRVYRISAPQMREFQRLLEQQGKEFNDIAYPTSSGASDYVIYTLTTSSGSVQYSDISQKNLPNSLKTVLETWNEISRTIR